MILASWLHNLSPFVVEFPRGFPLDGIRWYGTAYAVGFLLGWLLLRRMGRRGWSLIPPEHALDAVVTIAMGVIIGGRLGYAVLYNPPLLWTFGGGFPWWELLRLTDGGMASHGGMVGVLVACWIVARGRADARPTPRPRVPLLHVLDCVALLATPGLLLGRVANFINGELLGKVVAPAGVPGPWWSVRFPQEAINRWDELPRAQQEALAAAAGMPGQADAITAGFAWPQFVRAYEDLLHRLWRGSAQAAETLGPIISSRHPSQLYQAAVEGVALGVALLAIWRRPRKPGVILAWFMVLYGIGRIGTEFWRLPDAHLHVQRILGLSRGQWFSAALAVAGMVLLVIVSRRQTDAIGGWGSSVHDGRAHP